SPSNDGFPESLLPPGTLPDVAKERLAISAATTEHDCDVSFNQSRLFSRRFSCSSLKISPGVLSSVLVLCLKCSGTIPWMY
ncbi:hypothetical protein A2U01_0051018, partial [Trifolium medium]|nr:hypothetical protein [Trifolium medium]